MRIRVHVFMPAPEVFTWSCVYVCVCAVATVAAAFALSRLLLQREKKVKPVRSSIDTPKGELNNRVFLRIVDLNYCIRFNLSFMYNAYYIINNY